MRFDHLLASRYIKAQKRQSVFTVISIITAVAIVTMVFLSYSLFINCYSNAVYSASPYHLLVHELTEEQGEALRNEPAIRSAKLDFDTEETICARIMFQEDIGDREAWMQNVMTKIGALKVYEKSAYEWNDTLMMLDSIGNDAHLGKLLIFSAFFVFAVVMAMMLRMIVDTAFEISSKEREKHYGVLQSIGATPEQIVKIITSEGMRLCVIAVPLGLLTGILLAYVMYSVLLRAGISDIFHDMTNAKLSLPFTIDWKMLLVSAAVGVLWVFLSAYGVGMRIIRKAPLDAILVRTDEVKKVRKHSIFGLLFGISGSIASRNARRQKKHFRVTVLTMTVSIILFSLFSTLSETVAQGVSATMKMLLGDYDFETDIFSDPSTGSTYKDVEQELIKSGMFRNISLSAVQFVTMKDHAETMIEYMNENAYQNLFGENMPVSYEELKKSGGYVLNTSGASYQDSLSALVNQEVTVISTHITIPEDLIKETMDYIEEYQNPLCERERVEHTVQLVGIGKDVHSELGMMVHGSLIAAIETYDAVKNDYYSNVDTAVQCSFSYAEENNYNAADHRKIMEWLEEHSDRIEVWLDCYEGKQTVQNVMSAMNAGILFLNLLFALAALMNLINIISTGIANRRGEQAALQCFGMTDKQMNKMACIECLQYAAVAAVISALICFLIIWGIDKALLPAMANLFSDARENGASSMNQKLGTMIHLDYVTPFIRIGLCALAAFAAGCVTSLLMLRANQDASLSERIKGMEMKLNFKKTHILRNSVLAVVVAAVLTVTGLRTYSILSYRQDRAEFAEAGYLNLVDAGDIQMNIYSTGAEHGKHTIVGLSGMGLQCFPVITTELNERLGKENTLVYPDRAGYGFSDDSMKPQTLKQVVENYRTGLKNAGYAAPYVLMGHSYGSFYALYWQTMYPDEVEAIVFLDGTPIEKNESWCDVETDAFPSEASAKRTARSTTLGTWLGLDRLFPQNTQDTSGKNSMGQAIFSEEQLHLWRLSEKRSYSAAYASEVLLEMQSYKEIAAMVKPTDIPKLYFSTVFSSEEDVREYNEFMKADYEAAGHKFAHDPETSAKIVWEQSGWYYQKEIEHELRPFMEKIGNCKLIFTSGEHAVFYAQKPQMVADAILELLAEID